MTRAEELVNDVISNPEGSDSDGRICQLLEEYYHGAPLDSLRPLIHSHDERLEGGAAWIGSELPNAGRVLLDDMTELLGSTGRKARFFAIDCIQLWSAPSLDGSALSKAVALLSDEDKAVRWKALCFLATARCEQLETAAAFLTARQPSSPYLPLLRWILSPELTATQTRDRILSDNPHERRFAAVAAARLKDLVALSMAGKSPDDEAAQFARDMLERISVE